MRSRRLHIALGLPLAIAGLVFGAIVRDLWFVGLIVAYVGLYLVFRGALIIGNEHPSRRRT